MGEINAIAGETKDWSSVIEEGCAECGYAPEVQADIGGRLRHTAGAWQEVLSNPHASQRPAPHIWSPIEYAAHARDMCMLACGRVELMLTEHSPVFSNWDQDEQAVINDYRNSDARVIATELNRQLERAARTFDQVPATAWSRPGLRSDGKLFTVESFASFVLHEIEHHLQDATQGLQRCIRGATV